MIRPYCTLNRILYSTSASFQAPCPRIRGWAATKSQDQLKTCPSFTDTQSWDQWVCSSLVLGLGVVPGLAVHNIQKTPSPRTAGYLYHVVPGLWAAQDQLQQNHTKVYLRDVMLRMCSQLFVMYPIWYMVARQVRTKVQCVHLKTISLTHDIYNLFKIKLRYHFRDPQEVAVGILSEVLS